MVNGEELIGTNPVFTHFTTTHSNPAITTLV